jgi:hypothetical protein
MPSYTASIINSVPETIRISDFMDYPPSAIILPYNHAYFKGF